MKYSYCEFHTQAFPQIYQKWEKIQFFGLIKLNIISPLSWNSFFLNQAILIHH